MSYEAAIILASNGGARCLVSGDYERATKYLMEAFKKLTSSNGRYNEFKAKKLHAIPRRRKTSVRSQNAACDISRIHPTEGCDDIIIDDWMNNTVATTGEDVETSDGWYVYSNPIFIPVGDFTKRGNHLHINRALLSVIVSFNLGLAILELSRKGNSNKSNGKDLESTTAGVEGSGSWHRLFLFQSLKLFQHAFRLQRSTREKSVQSPLFFLAAVNNIGVLYSKLGKIPESNKCFQQIMSLLMYMNHGSINTAGGRASNVGGGVTAGNSNAFLNNIPNGIMSSTTRSTKNSEDQERLNSFAGGDLVAGAA